MTKRNNPFIPSAYAIQDDYCHWLYSLIEIEEESGVRYETLCRNLHEEEFYWLHPFDANRALDGIALRDIYKNVAGRGDVEVELAIEKALAGPTSVLEMMIGLAQRCEDQLMYIPGEHRIREWFWPMVASLDLMDLTDDRFTFRDSDVISHAVHKAMSREYDEYGNGGFFCVLNPPQDMREVDLWYQLNYWLEERGEKS